ncbi:MAG: response regulator [Chitinophagaceae bacterium]|nr:response regulator [Bacteroidota bacterium]TAJ67520.1 MAG: response regulator [Chitinophagaceae bacterium]
MTDVKQKHIVCLIDDDNIYQYTARVILESTGLAKQIHSFYDGKEALNYFIEQLPANPDALPDVIFLDINMPVMNGWEFLEEYNKLATSFPKPITVYMVSSSVNSTDMQRSRSYKSVSDYLVKPVNRNTYQELMENLSC